MQDNEKIPTHTYYRMVKVDNYTAQLWSVELTGRRVGKKTLIKESTPSVVAAVWSQMIRGGLT